MNNHAPKFKCPVCEHEIQLQEGTKDGDRITCPNCFAQLAIKIEEGRKKLKCALCANPKLADCKPDCERRQTEIERRGFFDVKL